VSSGKYIELKKTTFEDATNNEPRFLLYNNLTCEWNVKTKSALLDFEEGDVGAIYEMVIREDTI
jgi:hypothetical protein